MEAGMWSWFEHMVVLLQPFSILSYLTSETSMPFNTGHQTHPPPRKHKSKHFIISHGSLLYTGGVPTRHHWGSTAKGSGAGTKRLNRSRDSGWEQLIPHNPQRRKSKEPESVILVISHQSLVVRSNVNVRGIWPWLLCCQCAQNRSVQLK